MTFDDKLSWKCHVDAVVKNVHSSLHCLRKLRSFVVRDEMLRILYTATISSVVTFGMTCCGGNASRQIKNRLDNNNQDGRRCCGKKARQHRHNSSSISDKQTGDNSG